MNPLKAMLCSLAHHQIWILKHKTAPYYMIAAHEIQVALIMDDIRALKTPNLRVVA